ncbi:MAG TPA: hypothetical protein VIF60_16965 [Burkholderiaceae bacterium]|jgi:hypothetical protein
MNLYTLFRFSRHPNFAKFLAQVDESVTTRGVLLVPSLEYARFNAAFQKISIRWRDSYWPDIVSDDEKFDHYREYQIRSRANSDAAPFSIALLFHDDEVETIRQRLANLPQYVDIDQWRCRVIVSFTSPAQAHAFELKDLRLKDGRIGGALQDATGQVYAVTAGHVLEGVADVPDKTGAMYQVHSCSVPPQSNGHCKIDYVKKPIPDVALVELNRTLVNQYRRLDQIDTIADLDIDQHVDFIDQSGQLVACAIEGLGLTRSLYIDTDAHCYQRLGVLRKRNTTYFGAVSRPGDSGSWIVSGDSSSSVRGWAGMLCGGDNKWSYFCLADEILAHYSAQAASMTLTLV